MAINNPAGEAWIEQQRMHAEKLRAEIKDINAELANLLGAENYIVDREGNVTYTSTELLGGVKMGQMKALESRLKDAYAQLKETRERT